MPTEAKAKVIEETREKYSRARGVLFAEYRGLKVKELQNLRKQLGEKGGELHVVKNTLFKIAAGVDGALLPENLNGGPTAVAFMYDNEADCAKAILDFAKTHKNLVIKGGLIGGQVFDDKKVEALSKLPPKEVLLSQIIGLIVQPLTELVGTVEAIYADPIRTVYAVADKANEGDSTTAA